MYWYLWDDALHLGESTSQHVIDDCTDPDEKKQLRENETQLRDEKKQLRDKELILLHAKHHPTGINILDGWEYITYHRCMVS